MRIATMAISRSLPLLPPQPSASPHDSFSLLQLDPGLAVQFGENETSETSIDKQNLKSSLEFRKKEKSSKGRNKNTSILLAIIIFLWTHEKCAWWHILSLFKSPYSEGAANGWKRKTVKWKWNGQQQQIKKRKFSRTLTALPEHHSNSFFSLFIFLNTFFFWNTSLGKTFCEERFMRSFLRMRSSIFHAIQCRLQWSVWKAEVFVSSCKLHNSQQSSFTSVGHFFIIFHPSGICHGEKILLLTYPS